MSASPAKFCKTGASRLSLVLFMGTALALGGCGKQKQSQAVTPPPAEAASQAAQPAPAPAAPQVKQPATALVQPDGQVDLPELQRSLLRWMMANRRRPASFEDFAATAGTTIPPPPVGKKYVITKDMHVVLLNR